MTREFIGREIQLHQIDKLAYTSRLIRDRGDGGDIA